MSVVNRWSGVRALAWLCFPILLVACSLPGTTSATATPAPTGTIAAAATGTPPATGVPQPSVATPTLPPTPPTATILPATPATTPGTPASPSRPVASPSRGTPVPGPLGTYPAGWRVYQGPLPFAIAYPPDWEVDETQLGNNLVYFFAPVPDQSIFVVVATTGAPEGTTNLDILRDRWFQSRTRGCTGSGIDQSGEEVLNGIAFATVGATCDLPTGLAYSYTGLGVRGTVPWIFEFNAPYDDYAAMLAAVFRPMIQTFNIYGGVR